jgi:hypothetical protein
MFEDQLFHRTPFPVSDPAEKAGELNVIATSGHEFFPGIVVLRLLRNALGPETSIAQLVPAIHWRG